MFLRFFVCLIAKNNSKTHTLMEQKNPKWLYHSPEVAIIELKQEGVICASDVLGGNSINDWGNGGTTNDDVYM